MTGKWDALIAEAEECANAESHAGYLAMARILNDLATALREAQAHVPPEGWRVTEITHESRARVWADYDDPNGEDWGFIPQDRTSMDTRWGFPTAAAAMAAIEEMSK